MKRREFLKAAGASTASLALQGCQGILKTSFGKPPKRPNVLFFFADQLRADACSVYGGTNISTPNIDRLASRGIRFTNALSTTPLCTPYRGMVQTGRYPTHSGIVCNFIDVNPDQRCIAHVFNDAGYHTGFIGKWHLDAGRRRNEGKFKERKDYAWSKEFHQKHPHIQFVPPGPKRLGYQHWEAFNFAYHFRRPAVYRDKAEKIELEDYETDALTDSAINFMKECQKTDKPFFVMVAPHPPHPPFTPNWAPEGYLEKIKKDIFFAPNVPKEHPRRKDTLAIRCYYAMSKNIDDNVGRLTKFLDESGLAENTIFVFTSDHGEQHGSHNRTDKMVPYSESVDIPLIIQWKEHIPPGITTDELHSPIDHMTTLCGLVGIKPPKTADGSDLSKVALGKGKLNRKAVLMANYTSHWDFFQTRTVWKEWRGIRTKRYTYVKWIYRKEELYDNLKDPYQMKNLAGNPQYSSLLSKMRKQLKKLMADAHDEFLPGDKYGDWYTDDRKPIRTALGLV